MATKPRHVATPGEAPTAPVQTSAPPPGPATDDTTTVPPTNEDLAERVAQLTELTLQQSEQLRVLNDERAAKEQASQAAIASRGARVSDLTPDEALEQAKIRGRGVLSSEGWVCPPTVVPTALHRR